MLQGKILRGGMGTGMPYWGPIFTEEQTTLSMTFTMHAEMEGKHDFRVHIPNNDPERGDIELVVLSNWVP